MKELRKILVGITFDAKDGSLTEGARSAVIQALALRRMTGASVRFIHSSWRSSEDSHPGDDAPKDCGSDAAHAELDALAREDGPAIELEVEAERPRVVLTREAVAKNCDLVIVGKRNHSAKDDRKLGSVSRWLIHNCPCAVWVVKPRHDCNLRTILAATGLRGVGDRAVEYGGYLAQHSDGELHVVHAWQVPMELQLGARRRPRGEVEADIQKIHDDAVAHIEGLSMVKELGSRAKLHVGREAPSRAILAIHDVIAPDLAVIGTIARGGIAGLVVGNTAERLLDSLGCSLLTVKPNDFISPLQGK
jgi:nucleotide-binding universal stress UspA family protein